MILSSWWAIFLAAAAGGCLGEFLTLYDESRGDPAKQKQRIRRYWMMSALMALLGGGLAVAYGFKEIHILAAANIGASTPVLIKSGFASFAPPSKPPIG
jgi:hypothetical protein